MSVAVRRKKNSLVAFAQTTMADDDKVIKGRSKNASLNLQATLSQNMLGYGRACSI
jgi:hypothetical protein